MRPIDMIPGFAPQRTERKVGVDCWQVTVKPPAFIGGTGVTVTMSQDQYSRYQLWRGGMLIQDALPDLTDSQREGLMTGLADDEFAAACEDDDAPSP